MQCARFSRQSRCARGEISSRDNGYEFDGICKKYLKKTQKCGKKLFDITNFIRPEDVYLYEGLVSSLKLATRVSANPLAIIGAYINDGKYSGQCARLARTQSQCGVLSENHRQRQNYQPNGKRQAYLRKHGLCNGEFGKYRAKFS
ncbi:MAG: hypothetical protein L6V93_22050 [Clostridiales bacterium]|nr:MAG: hypothetical protein L6V93_22050 [Clostridiales bacterium]